MSVIIPTYNRADLIGETLDSVFAQTYRPIEILVVDDGSTDDSEPVIRHWQQVHSDDRCPLHYFKQPNVGVPTARNRGLTASRGEFIQFLDSDDLLEADKLERQVRVLRKAITVDVVYGHSVTGPSLSSASPHPNTGGEVDMAEALLRGKFNPLFTYLVRRHIVDATGPWDAKLRNSEDFDFFLRMAISGARFTYESSPTGLYRRHPYPCVSRQSGAIIAEATARILSKAERQLRENGTLEPRRATAIAQHYLFVARQAFAHDRRLFHRALSEAHRLDPAVRPANRWRRLGVSLLGYTWFQRFYNVGRFGYGVLTGK